MKLEKKKIIAFIKNYPIPLFVFFGILIGVIVRFGFQQPKLSQWIWLATVVVGGAPIVYNTVKGMFKGKFASDIVAMLAIITAILLNQAFAGAIVVLMQSGGEAIEAYGLRRATSSLKVLMERSPRFARRKRDDQLEEIHVEEVKVGDILIVRPGDLIPVDGTIVQGTAEIDESALTGEPLTKSKTSGDKLLSGSIDVNGALEMRADKVSSESQYAKIVSLVAQAQEEKAPIQRLADRYAIFFTPLTLVMAFLGFLITKDYTTILAVLVVATPCPLILAAPLAVICGINKAAREGIIVKGGAPLEQVAGTKAALFDKTGTITYGNPFVEKAVSIGNETEDEVLLHAAIIEQFSSHSIAKAIVNKAIEKFKTLPLPKDFIEFPGHGVEGVIDGHEYIVGSHSYLEEKVGASFNNFHAMTDSYYQQNKMLVFVVKDKICIGFFVVSDQIRPSVPAMITKLHQLGVREIAMLTGDSKKNAEAIAKEAGIDRVESQLLPQQKVEIVKQYKAKYEPIIMVGDGINDAPALATATVGIAMGAYGTAISAEAADIVLLVDDPSKVVDAIVIGKRMLFIAKQSIWIGIGLSFVLMIFAAFGYIIPVVGALLQEIIDVAVILNALRVR